jgi:hypothetical protein
MTKDVKKTLKITILSVFFLLIVGFAFINSIGLLFGVKIKNVRVDGLPAQAGSKMTSNVLDVTGNTRNAKNVTLNGREISIDKAGNFNETIILHSGYNVITITAKDKFGNMDEKNYQLMY